ncbi:hypothetical protein [Streptomyces albidoflavus]|uniref:hypothetical protein n=1 Tax=Streptomyces albidoflavus TaxID=1886 RepID=UPI00101E697B|nr:hypothetical protein [Streptomyces albidoflavus]RZD89301.1 hypothetical protein C0Q60_03570 [Streptomyces albidoflavus]RZE04960.1 hypothetical protein C0Q62_03485 [Streptomyces albidoflavus]
MTVARPGYDVMAVSTLGVRVGDLVEHEAGWFPIHDLRQLHPDGKAAVLGDLPGIWLLPPNITVRRPRASFAPRP